MCPETRLQEALQLSFSFKLAHQALHVSHPPSEPAQASLQDDD